MPVQKLGALTGSGSHFTAKAGRGGPNGSPMRWPVTLPGGPGNTLLAGWVNECFQI